MTTRWDEFLQKRAGDREEYVGVGNHWRFLQGTRIVVTAGMISAAAVLFSLYRTYLIVAAKPGAVPLDRLTLLLIPWLGIVLTYYSTLIETVISGMLDVIAWRGRTLELRLAIERGIFFGADAVVARAMKKIANMLYFAWSVSTALALLVVARIVS